MNPDNFTTNIDTLHPPKIYVEFDEYVQIKVQQKEFFTSPMMKKNPTTTPSGRGIRITILDTLEENQTYALNFGNSIVDNNEGNRLLQQYEMTAGLENDAYGRYRDTVGDWEIERAYAQNAYQQQYEQDYQNWVNMLNHWSQQAQQEYGAYMDQQQFDAQQAAQNREYAYNQAMAILAAGKMPTAELLAAAGISSADATNLMAKKSSGSSSSKKSTSGSASKPQAVPQAQGSVIDTVKSKIDSVKAVSGANTAAVSDNAVRDYVSRMLEQGKMTYKAASAYLAKHGL
jgi:hypothetical protein